MVSTHLKNSSQIGNLPQIGVKMKNIWNHHLDVVCLGWLFHIRNGAHSFLEVIKRNSKRISTLFLWKYPMFWVSPCKKGSMPISTWPPFLVKSCWSAPVLFRLRTRWETQCLQQLQWCIDVLRYCSTPGRSLSKKGEQQNLHQHINLQNVGAPDICSTVLGEGKVWP